MDFEQYDNTNNILPNFIEVFKSSVEKVIYDKNNLIYGISTVGPRTKNDDNISAKYFNNYLLLCVADGIGGYKDGDVASKIAINTLEDNLFNRFYSMLDYPKECIYQCYNLAHNNIKLHSANIGELCGTTLSSILINLTDNKYIIGNCGDSRIYIIRNGNIIFKSEDQTIVNDLVRNNLITSEEAFNHNMKNILSNALGVDDNKFKVDIYTGTLEKNDLILLSSDGLHDYIPEKKILEIINKNYPNIVLIVKSLVQYALKYSNDNISVLGYIHK